ncbi:hypothetical protein NQU54_24900 [Streptomyces samsunensis]|uniref:Uncharacterized protein n=1 Tax=Streptomyces malaysiensis subsp. samsunensis TaxID=459658 RepID=A0A9X2LZQ0_STRMQ|nr:hypothetical protein [Streptomyces samsunensis]MCQ8832210.1 hypothetical protein [Streptomyces samsunensis]
MARTEYPCPRRIPAAAQRLVECGVPGALKVVGEQAGHVGGVRLLGSLLLVLDVGGHDARFLQDIADTAGAGRVEHTADGLGCDVVLPGEPLHLGVLGVRVDDVGRLVLAERGRAPQCLARGSVAATPSFVFSEIRSRWNSRTPASIVTNSLVCGSSAARSKPDHAPVAMCGCRPRRWRTPGSG